jgi:hypothetical protein
MHHQTHSIDEVAAIVFETTIVLCDEFGHVKTESVVSVRFITR